MIPREDELARRIPCFLITKAGTFAPNAVFGGLCTCSLCAAAARFGVCAVLTVAARWHGDVMDFFPELFGSFEMFWEFFRLTNVIERVSDQPPFCFSVLDARTHVNFCCC